MEPLKDFINQNSNTQVGFDAGLRSFMLKVYNYLAMALGLSGVVAYGASTSDALMQAIFGTPLAWVVMLAPLGFIFFLGFRINKMSLQAAQTTFWAFAVVMGLSLSTIFLVYTGASIAKTFFISAAMFGGMSLYGYTTKRDLTSMGNFLIMGAWGIFIAMIVNLFVQSGPMSFVISALAVIIFTGLTAYDTQKLKQIYYSVSGSAELAGKAAIMGALNLYLDFINIFIHLLRFVGERR
jgi:FtsH-binding integral membrane protein